MGNSKKDEAKIEKIIRGLLKLPENRRCINCNLLGPQYVCTTFCTFVCTNCSGIHREFTHRVKSVSMAKFTLEEVEAIQAGGNERAKEIYFKSWDPQRHSYPESNNMQRLREFIKNVYVERKFTGEHHMDLPRVREAGKEEPYQSKKINLFRIEPKCPAFEARVERSSSARSSPDLRSDDNNNVRFYVDERRSPRYAQNLARHGSLPRKPIQIEVVDNRFRDGESRNSKVTDLDTKLKQLQPARQKTVDESQSPVIRPLGEVSGENGPSLKVSSAASVPEMQPISQPIEENWAIFEDFPVANPAENKISNTNIFTSSVTMTTPQPTHANSLDFLLSELSGPLVATTGDMSKVSTFNNDLTIVPVENSSTHGDLQHLPPFPISEATALPTSSDVWSIIPIANEMEQPSNALPSNDEINYREDSNKVLDWQTSPSIQYSPRVSVGSSSTAQPTSTPITPIAPNDMQSDVLNSHDSSSAFTELSPQTNSKPPQEIKPDVGSKPSTVENRSTGRMELPEDLFSSSYLSGPTPLSGWQNDQPQHHGMKYGLQYYPNAPSPSAFPIAARSSSNPFSVTEDKTLSHALSLPNMSCALPISPGAGLMHASSYGSLGMVPQSPGFGSPSVHPQPASGFPNSAYFGQVNNMQPPRFERAASTSDDESVFGSLSTMKLSSGEYMTQTTPNPFSKKGRNPFGDI